jgi:hypothetical protein
MNDAALHLPLQQPRIQHDAGINHRSESIDAHRACLRIDLDLADHDAGREGFDLVGEHGVACERLSRPPARTGRRAGRCRHLEAPSR